MLPAVWRTAFLEALFTEPSLVRAGRVEGQGVARARLLPRQFGLSRWQCNIQVFRVKRSSSSIET